MDIFVFILGIVALGIIGDVVKKSMDSKSKNALSDDEARSRFAELEQRVETLERIVTDQKTQLKQTIDSL
jgi:polyhydroxyalkanoate synthesis regulator phasin